MDMDAIPLAMTNSLLWKITMFNGKLPSVNCHITLENRHATNGKTHVISTGPFSIAMLNYQRVIPKLGSSWFINIPT